MGHWECKQHGKGCRSLVQGSVEHFNRHGIKPDAIPLKDREFTDKCLKWVEE